jgi:nitrite reductase (NADH) large subunit
MRRMLVIGCGMATAKFLSELASRSHDFAITVVGEESSPAYNRVLLSSLLAGDKQESDLTLLESEWYIRHGISLHLNEQVTVVDKDAKYAMTDKGRRIEWDLLVFATGSLPALPAIPGIDLDGVMAFRNLADLERIRAAAIRGGQAVVLGGGLLGLEAAHGLNRLGMPVTVLHRQPWILNRQLDRKGATVLQDQLEKKGVSFLLEREPVSLHGANGKLRALVFADGSKLPCDLLLLATGIVPNSGIASRAGIPCERGIFVDRRMRTACADIYAIGECCQHADRLYGLVAPVQEQAAVLAAWLCREADASYQYREVPVHLKIAGLQLVSAGSLDDGSESQVLCDPARGVYRRLVFRDDQLQGFVLIGDKRHAQSYQNLLEQGNSVSDFRSWMMFKPPGRSRDGTTTLFTRESFHA